MKEQKDTSDPCEILHADRNGSWVVLAPLHTIHITTKAQTYPRMIETLLKDLEEWQTEAIAKKCSPSVSGSRTLLF